MSRTAHELFKKKLIDFVMATEYCTIIRFESKSIKGDLKMKQKKIEAILSTAQKMFGRHGLQKTNLEEVAHMARVAKATIYNYFGSKDAIYKEVLKTEADALLEKINLSISKELSPRDKLISFIKAKFLHMKKSINILKVIKKGREKALVEESMICEYLFEKEVSIINSILYEGVKKGVFHINNTLLSSRAIGESLRGFELNLSVRDNSDNFKNSLDELTQIVCSGIMAEKSGIKV